MSDGYVCLRTTDDDIVHDANRRGMVDGAFLNCGDIVRTSSIRESRRLVWLDRVHRTAVLVRLDAFTTRIRCTGTGAQDDR